MSPEEKLRLTHIAQAAVLIADYVNGLSKEAFLSDTLRQDAVIRRIQIIGEAVRHLSQDLLTDMPEFPAKEARGMRNVLVHDNHGSHQFVRCVSQRGAHAADRSVHSHSPYSPSL